MGRFTDDLMHRARARRNARKIKHPSDAGAVMWCSSCRAELLRAPRGKGLSLKAQKAAVEAHHRVCKLRHLRPVPAVISSPSKPRRWHLVIALLAVALAAAASLLLWRR